MRRKAKIAAIMLAATTLMHSFSAFAGQWIPMGQDWYYLTDDGNVARDTWLWLDENHDGSAEFYHFDANGAMSKSTSVSRTDGYETVTFYFDANGAATNLSIRSKYSSHDNVVSTSCMAPYSISYNNGKYNYSLKTSGAHYDFKDLSAGFTDRLIDCGDHYTSNVRLIVYHEGSDPGLLDVMECYIPTTAYFSEDCMVKYNFSDEYIPISEVISEYEFYNLLSVDSVDADGYITSCSLMEVE